MNETKTRDLIVQMAKSLFDRGLTFGSSGNISVRIEDGWLMTPTGCSMGNIEPEKISKLEMQIVQQKPIQSNDDNALL